MDNQHGVFPLKSPKPEFLPNYLLTSDRESHLTEAFRVLGNSNAWQQKLQHLFYNKNTSSHDIIQWKKHGPRYMLSRLPALMLFLIRPLHQSILLHPKMNLGICLFTLKPMELQSDGRSKTRLLLASPSRSFLSFHSFQPNVRVTAYLSGVNPDLTPNVVVGARETGKTRDAGGFVIALQGLDWNHGLCAPPKEGMGNNKLSIHAVSWFHL